MSILLCIIFNILFIICVISDIRKMIIPDIFIFLMLIITIINTFLKNDFQNFYLGISIFSFPFLILLIVEQYLKKEIIGLGDVKLIICIGAYFGNVSLEFLYKFYTFMYIFSGLIVIVFFRNKKYIAFAPMMYITFIFFIFLGEKL
ncbi:prepilin peptidase [Caviibacter abscessus]|uniref:prepilin peptidase n=1 Tax=Caviibacter abscessus TaxID=1766719 RepID=UPI000836ADFE|nr:prepilin peptidase [Caviibacter abscessus]